MIDLGDLGGDEAVGVDINDAGQAIAQSLNPDGAWRAFLWENGVRTDLGTLPNAGEDMSIYLSPALVDTIPAAINNHGQVVGTAQPEPATQLPGPFIWEDGQIRNLNDLIDRSTGWVIRYAGSINDAGQIVATARLDGQGAYAVLLTPYCVADLAAPAGALDFSDVAAFLAAFAAHGFDADLAPPIGAHDFSDVVAFLGVFAGGCP